MTASLPAVECLSLDGSWTLTRPLTGESFPAAVPGCVHLDLQRAGVLPSMEWRDNEATQQALDQESWVYRRTFFLESSRPARLVCTGLDTLATVRINDATVLEADNMFREWQVDAQPFLQAGENSIEVTFHSTLPRIAAGQADRPLREWNVYFDRHAGRGYVRKMACSYGWDWGPVAPTAGIWKSLRLEFPQAARWTDLRIQQEHAVGRVTLVLDWKNEGSGEPRFELWRDGRLVLEAAAPSSACQLRCEVPHPELWWPNDLGAQPLYELRAVLADSAGREDVWIRRLGLRSLRLVRELDENGESFAFEINGRPFFSKGANWVPHRILLPEIARADYARLLRDAADSHMNMLRVWGGGIYESDDFYDLCDELGILVWQDFLFACGVYPTWDPVFLANVEAEAQDNIRRLRHHASLALWCGNNEIEGSFAGHPDYTWEEYGLLFDDLLPRLCADLDPGRPYWPGSAHSPVGPRAECNDDNSGDAHNWNVFFGRQNFEWQRTWQCRFMSEYGFQSFPESRTVESFTAPEDRFFMSRIMDYHQRSEVGNQAMISYLLEWFPLPGDFAGTLLFTQFTQALCVRYGAEHLRRIQPRCQGVLYWQLNDIWPCASWSSIDSFGRWKTLQYEAKRFFAPILASIEEDLKASTARIHLSNQLFTPAAVDVRWQITDTDGVVLLEGRQSVTQSAQSGCYLADLDARPFLATHHPHDLLVWAWALQDEKVVSRHCAPLARPKHLSLADPGLKIQHEGDTIIISCCKPALYVMLSLEDRDAIFEDNCFHLHPAEPRRLQAPADTRVCSLADWVFPRSENLPSRKNGYDLQRKR